MQNFDEKNVKMHASSAVNSRDCTNLSSIYANIEKYSQRMHQTIGLLQFSKMEKQMILKQAVTRKSLPSTSSKHEQLTAVRDGMSPESAGSLLMTFSLPFAGSFPESCTSQQKAGRRCSKAVKAQHKHAMAICSYEKGNQSSNKL